MFLIRFQRAADGQVVAGRWFAGYPVAADAAGRVTFAQPIGAPLPQGGGNPRPLKAEILAVSAETAPQQGRHTLPKGRCRVGQFSGDTLGREPVAHGGQQGGIGRGGQAFPVHAALFPGQGRRRVTLLRERQGQNFPFIFLGQVGNPGVQGPRVQVQMGGRGDVGVPALPFRRQGKGYHQQSSVRENLGDNPGGFPAAQILKLDVGKQFIRRAVRQFPPQFSRHWDTHSQQPIDLVDGMFPQQFRVQGQQVQVGRGAFPGQFHLEPPLSFHYRGGPAGGRPQFAVNAAGQKMGLNQGGKGGGGVVLRPGRSQFPGQVINPDGKAAHSIICAADFRRRCRWPCRGRRWG